MPDASGGAHNTQSDVSETFGGTPDEPGETPDESGETPDENTPPDAQITYELMSRTYSEIHLGDLVVVNNSHIYTFPTVSMENVTNYRERVDGTLPYLIPNINDPPQMQSEAAQQLSAMLTQYYQLSGDNSLVVYDAYRTEEEQADGNYSVAAGYSEHHTGLLVALSDSTTSSGLDAATYSWIYSNCQNYGFIQRYPSGKTGITGVSNYTEAFRYVGIPHATYMSANGLCLEEYVELLRNNHTSANGTDGAHLRIDVNGDGNTDYEVYYVPGNNQPNALTTVPVPKNFGYTISGDNIGGFIVTVDLNTCEIPDNFPIETPDEPSDEPSGPSAPVFSPSGAILLPQTTANTQTVSTQIASDYAALVNARTGEIIAGKGADTRFSPASMTKIMTLLVACQRLTERDLDQRVEYTREILDYTKAGGYRDASCHWSEEKYLGDRVAVRDLLYGIGVESAADCSIMVVCYLVGKSPAESEAVFVQWMNEEAAAMGLQNTHFDNVIGYESENNYSTAADMAAILTRALECGLIADILSRPSYEFLAYYTDESGAEGSYRNYSYSTLFDAQDTGSGRIGAYEKQYGEFTIAPLTLGGGKTGSLEYESWEYSLASFATDSAGNTYVLITGMCSQNAEVMRDAKTLYGYVRSD